MRWTEQRAAALRFTSRRSSEEIRECYMAMSGTLRDTQLPDILVGCLLTSAEVTLRVLQGLPSWYGDFSIRMDCLLKLRREPLLWSEIEKGYGEPSLKSKFYKELGQLRDDGDLPRFSLRAGHAGLILEEADTLEQGSRFFEKYLATYSDRESSVLLIFVDFFTRWQDTEKALGALRLISPEKLGASDKQILQRCCNLLKLDTLDSQRESKSFKILPQLLELGIKPDTFIHNMIIMNAIKANVSRVGWDLYEYLKAENLETDAVTYLLLMKDAFARQDVSGLNEILSAIHKREDLYHNHYLVGCTMNIIRIIYKYEKRTNPAETFSHILSIHNRAWLPNIYISLNMIQPYYLSIPENVSLENPPPQALAWTIFQYCLTQTQRPLVDRLWQRLTHALSQSDPSILSAAMHENFYAGFIIFYGRSPRTLGKAADIVQFMLDNPYCAPTGRTWQRLMCGYLRQGQHQEAEQIRAVMQRRGIKLEGKEFAYVLEHWSNTEVVARARQAIAGWRDLEREDVSLDEELFEGVGERLSLSDETAQWDDMIDLRRHTTQAETTTQPRARGAEMEARKAMDSVD